MGQNQVKEAIGISRHQERITACLRLSPRPFMRASSLPPQWRQTEIFLCFITNVLVSVVLARWDLVRLMFKPHRQGLSPNSIIVTPHPDDDTCGRQKSTVLLGTPCVIPSPECRQKLWLRQSITPVVWRLLADSELIKRNIIHMGLS